MSNTEIKQLEAVIFDLDGVITDTAKYHYIAWKELGEQLEIPFDHDFNETLKGISRIESLESILKLGNKQNAFTIEQKEELANQKNNQYVKLIDNLNSEDILPGITEFLNQLKAEKVKTAIASASKNAKKIIACLGLGSYFDYIVDASTVEKSKPNPEVFLKAAKAINVNPKNCIGIEDAVAGIKSINSANMFSVGIGSSDVLNDADLILASTNELNLNDLKMIFNNNTN